jgi:integrase
MQAAPTPSGKQPTTSPKRTLTDTYVRALKQAAPGQRTHTWDARVPGFGVRVTDRGSKSFVLYARVPPSKSPARLALGDASKMGLAAARKKAREWLDLIEQGRDPRSVEEASRRAEQQAKQTTLRAVAEEFIRAKLPGERKGREVERDIRRDLVPALGARPVAELTKRDVRVVIEAKQRTAPAQARNLLGIVKRLLAWAVDQDIIGVSPCESLKPRAMFGEKMSRDRVLTDEELFALWRAAGRTPYPHGPVYQLLVLTALRLNEVADATRAEIDAAGRVWEIPAARMKGRPGKAKPHAVPITDEMRTVLDGLPRFRGHCLFTTTFGKSPVWMNAKVKRRLDRRMLHTLRALARMRGETSPVELPPWQNHDIRRTVRSNLSRLKIAEEVREAVLAHVRPGIKGVYDKYKYLDEKRDALTLWAARLRSIVSPPPPTNVVALRGA